MLLVRPKNLSTATQKMINAQLEANCEKPIWSDLPGILEDLVWPEHIPA